MLRWLGFGAYLLPLVSSYMYLSQVEGRYNVAAWKILYMHEFKDFQYESELARLQVVPMPTHLNRYRYNLQLC